MERKFTFNGTTFTVSGDVCTHADGVIRLPGDAGFVVPKIMETSPPDIEMVHLATSDEVAKSKHIHDAFPA